jgi:hypothetical protein
MKRSAFFAVVAAVTAAAALLGPRPVEATKEMQEEAKKLKLPVQNCLHCHNEKLPKKNTVTHNDVGKWLIAEKEKRKAKKIEVEWLKDYQPPAK